MRVLNSMKYFFCMCLIVVTANASSQAGPASRPLLLRATDAKIASVGTTPPFLQASAWKTRISRQPTDAEAWFNYYLWTSRDKQLFPTEKEKTLSGITREAGQYISHSPEYDLMLYLQSGKKDSASMYRIINSPANKSLFYPYIIHFFSMAGNDSALKKYCLESEAAVPLAHELYQYHYNALMSAAQQSVVYARGINDLVPMIILQQVYQVRKDIRLKTYHEGISEKHGAYLSVSLGRDVLSAYPEAVYTGLLVRIKGDGSVNELKEHIEHDFDLSYMDRVDSLSADAAILYKNYLPSFILLYDHYKKTGNPKAAGMKRMIERIADKAGVINEITQLTGQ